MANEQETPLNGDEVVDEPDLFDANVPDELPEVKEARKTAIPRHPSAGYLPDEPGSEGLQD